MSDRTTYPWPPRTWTVEQRTSDADKLGAIHHLLTEELAVYPGDDVMRLVNKILDILTDAE